MLVDEEEILRIVKGGDLPVFDSPAIVSQVLKHAYGSELAGHY